jgi:hypothetical protein
VAANFTDLVDTALTAPISIDEFGNPFTGFNVAWTGTHGDGSMQQIIVMAGYHPPPATRANLAQSLKPAGHGRAMGISLALSACTCIALSSSGCAGTAPGQRGGRAGERFPRPGRHGTAEVPAAPPALPPRTQRRTETPSREPHPERPVADAPHRFGVSLIPADEKRPYGFKRPAVSRPPSDALVLERGASGLIMLRLFKGISQEGVDSESDSRRFALVCSVSIQQN